MMKKVLSMIVMLTMVLTLILTGCGEKKTEETADKKVESGTETKKEDTSTSDSEKKEEKTEEKKEEKKEEVKKEEEKLDGTGFTVGLVTDLGGIDDKSFNQGTWEGILRFSEETGAENKYLQSSSDADYMPNLSTFSDEELDLIVAPGFLFEESMAEVSANFPDQSYLIIDMVVGDRPNVANAVFAEHEGSFLVGIAAALKTKEAGEDTIGFIGGMDFDLIQKFEAGFEAGVAAVDPELKVLIEYAGSFTDSQKGQTLASKLYDQGAYVIYHAAGATGNGLIKEAKDRRTNGQDVWAIGVDKNQYDDGIYEDGKSAVLTSMMKRVDVAAYDVAKATLKGEFPGGEVLVFTLANGGVGLPKDNPNLTDDITNEVASFEEKVIAGEIEVPTVPNRLQ